MIDLFFCTCPDGDPIRQGFADACWARWQDEPLRNRDMLVPCLPADDIPVEFHETREEYQRSRRMTADRIAGGYFKSPIYILADDDCLPEYPTPFVHEVVQLMENYAEFGILAMSPTNSEQKPWRADDVPYTPFEDDEVFEHVSVGGIRFCRQGIVKEWPPMREGSAQYDTEHGLAIREAGYRVGWLRHWRMNHLGRFYSQTWAGKPTWPGII